MHYVKPFSSNIDIFFVEVPKLTLPSVKLMNEGMPLNISCEASGTPEPDVTWLRNGDVKSSGKKAAYLAFSNVNRADDGQYTCRANNSAGSDEDQLTLVVHCKYIQH